MKLQPFFLFLSLLLFILSSCEQAEKSRSYQLVRSDQTLAFTLDDKTKNVTPFLSYYRDKKGKEYIVLQSYSMQSRSNKFYFYDKDSQELAFKIEPEIEGSNGVGRVLGCYIQDWDSLYLTSLFEPEIIRINKDCQILEKINYEEANDGTRLYNSSFLSFRTATLMGRDLYIYSDPNRLIEKDYVSATINLDTKEIRALPFVYPDYPGSSVKLKRYGLEGSYSRSFDGQRFVYSFIYDESVCGEYRTRLHPQGIREKRVYRPSAIARRANRPSDRFLSKRDVWRLDIRSLPRGFLSDRLSIHYDRERG